MTATNNHPKKIKIPNVYMHQLYEIKEISFEELLKKDENSKTYIKNNLWKYHYVLTYLLHKRRFTTKKDGWVKVSVQKLKKILGHSKMKGKDCWFIDRIRKDLKKWGIILSKYVKTIHAAGSITRSSRAKIVDEVLALGYQEWQPNTIINLPVIEQQNTGVYANIQRSLSLVEIDSKAALQYTNHAFSTGMKLPDKLEGWRVNTNRFVTEDVWHSWKSSINMIASGRYEIHVQYESTGRVYTPVTSFPKKLKAFLTINGKKLYQLDCACSQPLLFGLYLMQHYDKLTPDMEHYIRLVQSGEFYPYIKQLLTFYNLPHSESTFKGEFFAKIFYSKEKAFDTWRCLFHQYFPGVSEAILTAKEVRIGEKKLSKSGRMLSVGGKPELLSKRVLGIEANLKENEPVSSERSS